MTKYLLLKHYRGGPTPIHDVPMAQWAPDEVTAHLQYMQDFADRLTETGETTTIACDQIFKAIGQTLAIEGGGPIIAGGKIEVDAEGRTSMPKVWAGGDCAAGGDDLTVTAVAEGRDAAESMHIFLMGGSNG